MISLASRGERDVIRLLVLHKLVVVHFYRIYLRRNQYYLYVLNLYVSERSFDIGSYVENHLQRCMNSSRFHVLVGKHCTQ
jgi:hypothetical protein